MQKYRCLSKIVVLITMLAVAISGCDDPMTTQMDTILDTVIDDPQPPASSTEGMVLIPAGEFQMGSNSGESQ